MFASDTGYSVIQLLFLAQIVWDHHFKNYTNAFLPKTHFLSKTLIGLPLKIVFGQNQREPKSASGSLIESTEAKIYGFEPKLYLDVRSEFRDQLVEIIYSIKFGRNIFRNRLKWLHRRQKRLQRQTSCQKSTKKCNDKLDCFGILWKILPRTKTV